MTEKKISVQQKSKRQKKNAKDCILQTCAGASISTPRPSTQPKQYHELKQYKKIKLWYRTQSAWSILCSKSTFDQKSPSVHGLLSKFKTLLRVKQTTGGQKFTLCPKIYSPVSIAPVTT